MTDRFVESPSEIYLKYRNIETKQLNNISETHIANVYLKVG